MIDNIKKLLDILEVRNNINHKIKDTIVDINNSISKYDRTKYYNYSDNIEYKFNGVNLNQLSLRDSKEIILSNDSWKISFRPPYKHFVYKRNHTKNHFQYIYNTYIYASKKYLYTSAIGFSTPQKICSLKSLLENKSLDTALLKSLIKIWQLNFKRYNLINNKLFINFNKQHIGNGKEYRYNEYIYYDNYRRDIKDIYLKIENGYLEILPNVNIYKRVNFFKMIKNVSTLNDDEVNTIKSLVLDDFFKTVLNIIKSRDKKLYNINTEIETLTNDFINKINIMKKLKN